MISHMAVSSENSIDADVGASHFRGVTRVTLRGGGPRMIPTPGKKTFLRMRPLTRNTVGVLIVSTVAKEQGQSLLVVSMMVLTPLCSNQETGNRV